MCSREDNQEVGLEAATLERVRNSSLVKWFCADNVAGLKYTAEAAAFMQYIPFGAVAWMGRGASCTQRSCEVIQQWRVRE